MEKPWFAHYEKEVPRSIDYPRIPLHQTLEDSARKYPDQTALKLILRYLGPVTLGATLTYRQLLDQVNRFAAALASLGVKKGDRVALMLPNLPQFVIGFYGALKLGAIVVNTNPTYTTREIEHQFSDAGAETVVILSGFYSKLKEIQAHTAVKRVIIADIPDYVPVPFNALVKSTVKKHGQMVDVPEGNGVYAFRKLLDAHPETPPAVAVAPDDTALFQYTGGTTGVPKAAMLTHYNLVVNTVQVKNWMRTLEDGKERMMGAIPFFHVYGMTVSMSLAMYTGAQLLILPNPRPIDGVMKAMHKERATVFPGVPAMYIGIINHPQVKAYDLRSIKACISGSAPLPMDVQVKFGEITGGRLVEGYGLTEAAPVTHCNPIYGQRKSGSIGVPFPDVEAKIVDYEKLTDKPVGEDGELWVARAAGDEGLLEQTRRNGQAGHRRRLAAHRRHRPDGRRWLLLHRGSAEGHHHRVGLQHRPREVEEVLFLHPKVQEAVVAGVPDPYRGETVKAYVVLKPGATATPDEIITFCAENLAPYKVPKQVEFRSELPKTMVGKVLRRVLVEEEKKKLAKA